MGGSGLTAKAPVLAMALSMDPSVEALDGGGIGGWFSFDEELRC